MVLGVIDVVVQEVNQLQLGDDGYMLLLVLCATLDGSLCVTREADQSCRAFVLCHLLLCLVQLGRHDLETVADKFLSL